MNTYKENPSIQQALKNTEKGVRVFFANNGTEEFSVYKHEEEENKNTTVDFTKRITIDKDQFIKLYIYSFPVLSELKNSTKVLFQYILYLVNKSQDKDKIYISYKDYLEKTSENKMLVKISQPTFSRGINELLEKNVIFKSTLTNLYFINISYVFNGDRLKFITEYQLKKQEAED